MIFNSHIFLYFFVLVLVIFYSIPHKFRVYLLLISSYIFYGWWNPYYLFLIVLSSLIDYFVSIKISNTEIILHRKLYLWTSIIMNLLLLFTFKYANFFAELFQITNKDDKLLNVLLPVGISFYTFQTMSYTIDVYRKKLKVEKNIFYFLLYVSYFPQLVAGPIERASNILHQLKQKVSFDMERISRGLIFAVYGFFQKVVIADNLSFFTELVFNNPEKFKGISIVIGTFLFGFQIYNDFYGYTNIAKGVALMMGVELMENFKQPFFADSIRNFWKRWHISLTTWFKDYLYIPLGGNKVKIYNWILIIIITFTVSGLWHGANLTYILWGFLNALIFIIESFFEKIKFLKKIYTEKYKFIRIFISFILLNFLWIIFRANSIQDIAILINNLLTFDFYIPFDRKWLLVCFILVAFSVIFDLIETRKPFAVWVESKNIFLKNIIIYFMIMAIILIGNWHLTPFIYFQF